MNDIVERLRESAKGWFNEVDTRREAADEIERLRARLAEAERLLREADRLIGKYNSPSLHSLGMDIIDFLADQPSAPTRDWRETVNDRLKRDPEFAEELRKEADKGSLADELQANGMKPKPVGSK